MRGEAPVTVFTPGRHVAVQGVVRGVDPHALGPAHVADLEVRFAHADTERLGLGRPAIAQTVVVRQHITGTRPQAGVEQPSQEPRNCCRRRGRRSGSFRAAPRVERPRDHAPDLDHRRVSCEAEFGEGGVWRRRGRREALAPPDLERALAVDVDRQPRRRYAGSATGPPTARSPSCRRPEACCRPPPDEEVRRPVRDQQPLQVDFVLDEVVRRRGSRRGPPWRGGEPGLAARPVTPRTCMRALHESAKNKSGTQTRGSAKAVKLVPSRACGRCG